MKFYSQAAANETREDLLTAQRELGIGHGFAETQLQINRNIISSYIELMTSMLIDSFMDTWGEIHIIQESVNEVKFL